MSVEAISDYKDKYYREGRDACLNGDSLFSMLQSDPIWHCVNGADLYRLVGYIEAMSKYKQIKLPDELFEVNNG